MGKTVLKNIEWLGSDNRVHQGDIGIDNDVIVAAGTLDSNWQPDRIIDGTNKLAVPGFINTHTHAAMTLFRSYADDMQLMDWLQNKIWPAEAKLEQDDIYWGTLLAIAEMIKTGTTTFADMYFSMQEIARAVEESGIRAVLARGMAGVTPNAEQALLESETFFKEYHNSCDGRITVMLAPHAPYTCPPPYLKKVVQLAEKLGAEIHTHLSETAGEVEDCLKEYGASPIALMEEVGLLAHGVLAAHCVHVSLQDIEIMRERNVRVAHNPGSNLKLASGIAPVPQMLAAGICVGLGTDGAASNNNLDMLEETRLAALVHKANTGDPLAVPAAFALQMATANGAFALGLGDRTGKLDTGCKADITIFDIQAPHWYPRHDRLSLLTYAASAGDVHTVIVNGRILMENRRLTTLDEERIYAECQARGMRLCR
ncbi:metal-dependent hydrolase [Lucifera butyrica]|uniref:5-methylthioadenosine/S-adenosylhomocysteine deaminase n=1 Tax=Lucifera butyrica TaxID=1351585 RepID=A0A498RAE1_9FIRM|nr:amidohydrolase [Lucifera butyrica]VBB07907.1 metal-dependent hydrolase [Lucifera butyrica]